MKTPTKIGSKKRKPMPAWATEPLRNFAKDIRHLEQLVRIGIQGINMVQRSSELIEALMVLDDDDTPESREEVQRAKKDAAFAKKEVEAGFPLLHAWAVVGTWALFESTIRTFVAEWLKHKRTAWRVEQIQKLRIKLGEYESIPKNAKHYFVVQLLEREQGAGLKQGVNRFETLLEPFGLSGEVPQGLSNEIYEFSQVRNLIVHNASKVDRRFREGCPWLNVKIGEVFRVSPSMFFRYTFAVVTYALLIRYRAGEAFGADYSDEKLSLLKQFEKTHSKKPKV